MIDWKSYCRWAHESGTRKVGPDTSGSERAALFKIWSLGVGGEFLEFLLESFSDEDSDLLRAGLDHAQRLEGGDYVFYLGRMYVDTGNERREDPFKTRVATIKDVIRGAKDLVECAKKAYRSEGDQGLVRLSIPECEFQKVRHIMPGNPPWMDIPGTLRGRREEFGVLLDRALSAFESWIVTHGSSLSEVCELNIEKLVKRRKEGLISAQGERVSDLGRAVRPEDLRAEVGIPGPKRSG